jgi:hypothetical protein
MDLAIAIYIELNILEVRIGKGRRKVTAITMLDIQTRGFLSIERS